MHPLDAALVLQPEGDGSVTGHTSPAYANMIGPFGGITAATLVQAMRGHPARLGEPLALTVNYAGPVADGPFSVQAEPLRTNRSTQHWRAELRQDGQVAVSATAVFGVRRETWASTEIGFPAVPAAGAVPALPPLGRVAWTRQYEMRFVSGGFPDFSQGRADADATTTLWMRDEPPRPLDFASLTALCDVFFPRIYLRRRQWTPAGTVSMTIYFHADAPMLAAHGTQPVLGVARAQRFGKGFFDQSAEVWAHDGALLASTHQIVYYKE
ncbi:acyl-CoA thioesterase II [Ideonella sp. A 288]|uniref:acyl-CoA thioesterase n=1 Tax=Ideonella sp. A 288 TaxID=1962181 RepID=UPI000B4B578D|nr:thioesterase family protein [Ideonella sp. A 288]